MTPPNMKRTVNFKAVLILTGSFVVVGLGIHLLHGFQIERNARELYEQALLHEKSDQLAEAADLLEYYLGMEPSDTKAMAQWGLLLRKVGTKPGKAFEVLEQVLRRDGNQPEIRLEAARLAMDLRRYTDAQAHLQILLKTSPQDAELLTLYARGLTGIRQYDKAAEAFAKALLAAPQQLDLYQDYARVLREHLKRLQSADEIVERMVRANERSLEARLAAANYFRSIGAWEKAHREILFIVKDLSCQDAEVLLLAAEIAQADGDGAEARQYLQQGRQLYPQESRFYQGLARLELEQGQIQKARTQLESSLSALPEKTDDLWQLASLLLDAGNLEKAQELTRELEKKGATPALSFLQARLLTRQGAWGEARVLIEKVRVEKRIPPILSKHMNVLLAQCYEQLGNPDQQRLAARRALEGDSAWLPARLALASAQIALGQFDLGIAERRLLARQSPERRKELADLLIQHNLSLPLAARNWTEVEQVIKEMTDARQPTGVIQLLRAQVWVGQEKLKEARDLLEAERKRDAKQLGVWILLAQLTEKKDPSALLSFLDEAERQTGKHLEWELFRIGYWSKAGPKEAQPRLAKIEAGLDQFSDADRDRLRLGLAGSWNVLGDFPATERLMRQYLDRHPKDLMVRFTFFEWMLQRELDAEGRRLLKDIKRLEGDGGPMAAYGEAALQYLAGKNDPQLRKSALQRLAEAGALRPTWSRIPLLEAKIHDLQNNKEEALAKYLAALERGETRPATLRRALQLSYELGRYAEAHALLGKLPDEAFTRTDIGPLATQLSLVANAQDPAQSRQRTLQAARLTAGKSRDYQDHLWLGLLAWKGGHHEEAEKALRQARQLRTSAPETWAALLLFLARTDAKKVDVELAEAQRQLAEEHRPQVLAPCYEALGRIDQAEEQYRAALAGKINDPSVVRQVASFYLRARQLVRAEPLLRELMDQRPEATASWARLTLARAFARQGSYQGFQKALALLDENTKKYGATPEDQQARAFVLATQPSQRREAIRLLETLPAQQLAAAPEAKFGLAELYDADGQWAKARGQMLAVLTVHDDNAVFLSRFLRTSLRRGEKDELQPWVDKLVKVRPDTFETVELRARVLHAVGKSQDAADLLKAFAKTKDAPLDMIAGFLDQFGQTADAEKMYRAYMAASPRLESSLLLALHLGRHQRLTEALNLCEQAWPTCRPETVAQFSVEILRIAQGNEEQQQRVERWLTNAIDEHPQKVPLRVCLAELNEQRGRYDEAIGLYRAVLKTDKQNYLAMNNLAYLLTLKTGETREALELINTALDGEGSVPALLDTRAVIYLKSRLMDPAIKDLDMALRQTPVPTCYFHLAQAHHLAGKRQDAALALRKAIDSGLKLADLHRGERSACQQLAADLNLSPLLPPSSPRP